MGIFDVNLKCAHELRISGRWRSPKQSDNLSCQRRSPRTPVKRLLPKPRSLNCLLAADLQATRLRRACRRPPATSDAALEALRAGAAARHKRTNSGSRLLWSGNLTVAAECVQEEASSGLMQVGMLFSAARCQRQLCWRRRR